ncbi:kinase-like protein [Lentinus tigrinus ALCF2SS1-6]|uniref:non-specific serine/threonine protein kinase n=1 Tax=Lentinus tigrinus ALCF2SS1-6 TaxID=1328759 RepID=A0A5C2SEN6_9APHY|nr:kinase-like protein [Lentinus tigrinus ALCF2SS1-6]
MPSWFSQATTPASTSTSAPKTKKTFAATFPKPLAPLRVVGRARPPPVRLPMLPQSAPRAQHPSSSGSGARAGKATGDAKGALPSIAKPSRLPFSSIQPEAGGAAYHESGPTRTVRFQLPSSTHSSSAEPSSPPPPPPQVKTAARGPEYVTITRPEHEWQRRRPDPLPLRPAPEGFAYNYPHSPFSPYERTFGGRENATPTFQASRVGPIKLLKTLQSGAFGASYIAHDAATGRVVCARTVKKEVLDRDERLKRGLLVEAQCYKAIAASAARDRAHLMEAHGILQDDQSVLFVMPLMQCDLLDALAPLGENGRLDRALVRRWVAQLALGIDALHRMGIIHRDIKPENVLLDGPGGNVRIADFNAALYANGGLPLGDVEVFDKAVVGSVPYVAYETGQGKWYGKMVDWWALGCVMFDLLTNTLLFRNHGARKTYAEWNRKVEGMSYFQSMGDLTDEEESVIAGLVDVLPGARYQLRHLRHHAYFFGANRVNVFDTLLREPPAADLLSDRLKGAPLCHASVHPPKARPASLKQQHKYEGEGMAVSPLPLPSGVGDFSGFGWVNRRGIWGASR